MLRSSAFALLACCAFAAADAQCSNDQAVGAGECTESTSDSSSMLMNRNVSIGSITHDAWTRTMVDKGNGCCRFHGWRAEKKGYHSIKRCKDMCMEDSQCTAADTARPRGQNYYCCLFYGTAFDGFKTECGTQNPEETCFRKETHPVFEKETVVATTTATTTTLNDGHGIAHTPEDWDWSQVLR